MGVVLLSVVACAFVFHFHFIFSFVSTSSLTVVSISFFSFTALFPLCFLASSSDEDIFSMVCGCGGFGER